VVYADKTSLFSSFLFALYLPLLPVTPITYALHALSTLPPATLLYCIPYLRACAPALFCSPAPPLRFCRSAHYGSARHACAFHGVKRFSLPFCPHKHLPPHLLYSASSAWRETPFFHLPPTYRGCASPYMAPCYTTALSISTLPPLHTFLHIPGGGNMDLGRASRLPFARRHSLTASLCMPLNGTLALGFSCARLAT